MSEIRERLKETGRAIDRWKDANDPFNSSIGLQWEFLHLGKKMDSLTPYWRKDDLHFNVLDEDLFKSGNLQENGKLEEVESIFEGQPSMKVFTIPAEKYFELNRYQIEILQKAAKLINKSKKD